MEDQDRTEPETGAEETTPTPPDATAEQPVASEAVDQPVAEVSGIGEADSSRAVAEEEPVAEEEEPAAEEPAAEAVADAAADNLPADAPERDPNYIPGADLEPDLIREADSALGEPDPLMEEIEAAAEPEPEPDDADATPIADAAIDLGADARYRATGRRKRAVARVTLRPGTGTYTINGKALEDYFPRATLLRQIRQPLETVGYDDRMDVVASMQGGGVSAQAGALRHGISRALQEADPNLRGELKRRGFLTRDARAKERKKAGLKKARKRPQFSKR